jgi:ABC-type arginine transport system ATPase subunit
MATINSDTIEIKVSELLRDDQPTSAIMDAEVLAQLIDIIQELVGDKRLVEVSIK